MAKKSSKNIKEGNLNKVQGGNDQNAPSVDVAPDQYKEQLQKYGGQDFRDPSTYIDPSSSKTTYSQFNFNSHT